MAAKKITQNRLDNLNFDIYNHRPLLVVISGPSGIGKDAVVKMLRKRNFPFHFVVTVASRPPRPGEVEGKDYFFVSNQKFEEMIANDELAEYSVVYDTYKGVPKAQINEALSTGKDVLMRLDVQGAKKIKMIWPEAVLIFLLPSNAQEWYQRLVKRDSESAEQLRVRVHKVSEEMQQTCLFDYAVVNAENGLDHTVDEIMAIITAEHLKLKH